MEGVIFLLTSEKHKIGFQPELGKGRGIGIRPYLGDTVSTTRLRAP